MSQLISSFISQLGQGLSGSFGDYLGLLFASLGVAAALCRALDIFRVMRTLNFLLNPDFLTFSSVALWTNGDATSIHHQYLTMLLFSVAMFLRFSGTWVDSQTAASLPSLIQRWFVRMGEYAILVFALPSFKSIAHPQYVVPLLVLISTARTNEVFRAWNPADGKRSPSEEEQMRKALDLLLPLSTSYTENGAHQVQLQEQEKSLFQLGFLWVDGSGTLIIAALTVVIVSIVSMAGSLSLSLSWLVLCVEVLYAILAVYLGLQCLPGWINFLNNFGVFIKDQNREWLREVKDWILDMTLFLRTITSGSFPLRCRDVTTIVGLIFALIQGTELALHVVIAALCRLLSDSLFLCIVWIVRQINKLPYLLGYISNDAWIVRQILRLINRLPYLPGYISNDAWIKIKQVLWKFVATICAQELLILKDVFQDPASFILIGATFIQMNDRSEIELSRRHHGGFQKPRTARLSFRRPIIEGYCWVEAEQTKGYGYLDGSFVELPFRDARENTGVVGGWVSEGDVRSCEWGDSEYNPECCENVGHFYGGLEWRAVFDQGEDAATLQVWLKFGTNPVRISHLWSNTESKIGNCRCEPLNEDPNVRVVASNVTSWPQLTTFKFALISELLR